MAAVAVLGAGPHGRQVAHDIGTDLLYDDYLNGYEPLASGVKYRWIVGAVWPTVRRTIVGRLSSPTDNVYRRGVYLSPHAIIGIETVFGAHSHVLAGAIVSHGCELGEFVTVATGAKLCGEVHVDDGAIIGAGAVVIHGGVHIGANAVIGAGAVVIEDVPSGATVVGVPGRCI